MTEPKAPDGWRQPKRGGGRLPRAIGFIAVVLFLGFAALIVYVVILSIATYG
jgi:hypothetical protein